MTPPAQSDGFGPTVSSAWLRENLDKADVMVADVRWYLDDRSGRDAYEAGHIPGAVFVDLDTDLAAAPSFAGGRHPLPSPDDFAGAMSRLGISDTDRVVAYDDVGGAIAARMWWMLDLVGVPAAVLDGGIGRWDSVLSTDTHVGGPGRFESRAWPMDRIVSADQLDSLLDEALVLDARDAERFAQGSAIDPRPGHVPGARSAPFAGNLADGSMRSPSELRRRYEALGAGGRPVIAYCGSGVTACHDLLALRRAGLSDGRLFVGSWSAWGADPDRPTETGPDLGPGSEG